MAFSHATAAHLFGAPLPSRLDAETRIHVSVAAPARAPQITGVVGHVTSRLDIAVREGLPVTAPEQTWLDLASCLRRDELVMVGDFFLAQRSTSMDALAHALQSASGRRGVSSARAALPLLREGSESPAESALRVQLHDAGLVPPELNYRIHDRDGSFIARVDMAYPDQRVVIEYEGDYHRVDRAQWHKDIHRQARLEDRGWRVIRATASDLADPADLILRVRRALTRET
jgi:very-short-patch-repair endonuclease